MDNCGSPLSSVYLLRSVLLLLMVNWPLIVGGDTLDLNRRGIISNVNFGAFMTPINRIINSGSTWTHTYQIEGLTENPIPPELRKNTTLTYEACLGIATSIIYMTFNEDSVKNYTKDQAIKFETDQCSVQEDWFGTKDKIGSSNVHLYISNPHLDLVPQEILVMAP